MDQVILVGRAAFVAAKSVVLVQEKKAFALQRIKDEHQQVRLHFVCDILDRVKVLSRT